MAPSGHRGGRDWRASDRRGGAPEPSKLVYSYRDGSQAVPLPCVVVPRLDPPRPAERGPAVIGQAPAGQFRRGQPQTATTHPEAQKVRVRPTLAQSSRTAPSEPADTPTQQVPRPLRSV